jgi:hypothetical protein
MGLERFYWIADGTLAGSSRPGGRRDDQLADHLAELQGYGIGAIVSLTETPIDEFAVADAGMTYAHIPIVDMTAPNERQLLMALEAIDIAHSDGRSVLAAWRIRQGATTDDAIVELRLVCDHAVENDLQIACLRAFELDRGWMV